MKIDLFDYHLPKNLIAQEQIKPRDHSKLLLLDKTSGEIQDSYFYNILNFLDSKDVLVLNETKVFPSRLYGQKITGAKVEVFLVKKIDDFSWECLVGGRGLKIGDKILFDKKLIGEIASDEGKIKKVKFNLANQDFLKIVEHIGHTPLPPYIKTPDSRLIKKDYQTVFAKNTGSAAAPTAGLHFTPALLKKIEKAGIPILKVTLHVGLGTFAPVEVEDITKHEIHSEWASVDKKTAEKLNQYKEQGKNIVAVGTTAARTLEAFADRAGVLVSGEKWVNIYIYPGIKFKFVNSLITNFHLPKSSLLFMVSAMAGRENVMRAYKHAVQNNYRFFSFGDAMLIKDLKN
ncbi:tRNA preQ1(34) S-adenosylmethionine ribosyltransferase-isomerase QueA [Patescibacteria group bacterium]|nr:tRNA preQ1(34) S-adenosylmethionine ribosyltransferase-isomerase QueA [Patescibacteria group bacterium]